MAPPDSLLQQLRAVLGPGGYLESAADIAPFLTDHRQLYTGRTQLVARPQTVAQVADVVRACAAARVPIVPQGGNTGYCGGAAPRESGDEIVLSLARLNRIRRVDAAGNALTVDAGVTLLEAQQAAAAVDRLFPLSMGSEGTCQVGGNLSTNAGGLQVLRYGMARELVLGLEVVLPDGRVLNQLSSLRKDNTGYDVKQLFIGAEGTLGVITGACLKLFPRPAGHVTAMLAIDDVAGAVDLLARVRGEMGDGAVAFELLPRIAVELAVRHVAGVRDPLDSPHPWYVLVEIAVPRAVTGLQEHFMEFLADLVEQRRVRDAVVATSEAQRLALWHLREHIPEGQRREGASLKHDVSLPIAALAEFQAQGAVIAAQLIPGSRLVSYGHIGDGNLHFNVSPAPGADAAAFLAHEAPLKRVLHDLVASFGGSISAEHGIGRLKVGELERYEDPVALELMHRLKRALDPHGLMNPGKVLAGQETRLALPHGSRCGI